MNLLKIKSGTVRVLSIIGCIKRMLLLMKLNLSEKIRNPVPSKFYIFLLFGVSVPIQLSKSIYTGLDL